MKEEMKRVFVAEMMRRQKVSGTFEVTEGTVKPFKKYLAGDPVAAWYLKNRDLDMTDKDWNPECDCEYLRDAMKNLGQFKHIYNHLEMLVFTYFKNIFRLISINCLIRS